MTSCTARDGSNWGLQAWQRMLPNYGLAATPKQAVWELRLSHWTGDLPALTVNLDWAYRKYDHLFGTFTYDGKPVHGFKSTSWRESARLVRPQRLSRHVRLGLWAGWRRENSFLTHKGTGTFCYGLYPHGARPAGHGARYRATIIGPGVTPDVMWQGTSLGAYDESLDRQLADVQRELYAGDSLCKPV